MQQQQYQSSQQQSGLMLHPNQQGLHVQPAVPDGSDEAAPKKAKVEPALTTMKQETANKVMDMLVLASETMVAQTEQSAKLQALQSTAGRLLSFEAAQASHMVENERLRAQVQHYEGVLRNKECQLEELHQRIRMLESNNFNGGNFSGNFGGNFDGHGGQGGNFNGQDGYGRGRGRGRGNRGRGRKGHDKSDKAKNKDMQT
jgi:hypothetical protein